MSNIYWDKLTFSKLVRKKNFLERKFEEMQESFILALSSPVFLLQSHVSDFFSICFAQKIKSFYQSSLKNKANFRDIMYVSPNTLAKIKILKNWDKVLYMKEQW